MTAAELNSIEELRKAFAAFSVAAARDVVPREEYRGDQRELWRGVTGARTFAWRVGLALATLNVAMFVALIVAVKF